MKYVKHEIKQKDTIVNTLHVEKFATLQEASNLLGDKTTLQYINKAHKDKCLRKARLIHKVGTDTVEAAKLVVKQYQECTNYGERQLLLSTSGIPQDLMLKILGEKKE